MRTTAAGRAQGWGVTSHRYQPQVWSVELTCFHGLNVVSYKVVTINDGKRTPIISLYLPPSILEHLTDL